MPDLADNFRVHELTRQSFTAGGGEAPRGVAVYLADGAGKEGGEDAGAAYRAVANAVPASLFGLPFLSIDLVEAGGGVWTATCNYGVGAGRTGYGLGTPVGLPPPPPGVPAPPAPSSPPQPEAGTALGPEWSFDTTGGTQRITQSLLTRQWVTPASGLGSDADNPYKRGVNVTRESVEGADIIVRKLEIGLTVKPNWVTLGWLNTAYLLTGTTNHQQFLGFDPGEVLFLGTNGQSQTPTDGRTPAWTVGFRFAVSWNRTYTDAEGAVVNDPATGRPVTEVAPNLQPFLKIGGWDYVWVSYSQSTAGGRTVLIPQTAHCEIVYPSGDMSRLGLFSPPPPPPPPPPP